MAIELRQQLKLTQQLVMTPQLQQAIKLLQLSLLELVSTVQQELEENPVLEESYEEDLAEEGSREEAPAEAVEVAPQSEGPPRRCRHRARARLRRVRRVRDRAQARCARSRRGHQPRIREVAMTAAFHLPIKAYSIIDAINRAACATGSMRYAQLTESSDDNGHAITVSFNDYRQYYVAEYFWAGRIVISRGDCESVLRHAIEEYNRQGRGASLSVSVNDTDATIADKAGLVIGALPPPSSEWYSWKHREVGQAMHIERQYGIPATTALLDASSKEDFDARWAVMLHARIPKQEAAFRLCAAGGA